MSELDPSAIVGNQLPKTVGRLEYQCYERAWRGYAQGSFPSQLSQERAVVWGDNVEITFDAAEPGVIKGVYIETPEETARFAGAATLEEEVNEREMLAQVLGVDIGAFSQPIDVDLGTLTDEQLADYDYRDPLYTSGEAFGRQAIITVNIDDQLARDLYDQAVARASTISE